METVKSRDGTTISFRRTGSGPPLLLVHGTTADHTRWSSISPQFEEVFTVLAMDRRGRGGSGDAPDYDLMREAEDIAAVVDKVGEPVRLLGHSYGAVCSLEAALLTSGIPKLVLYEPPIPTGVALYPPGLPDRMAALMADGRPEDALELFMRQVVQMPGDELSAIRRLPMWPARVALTRTIPRELAIDRGYRFDPQSFADFQVPTLLLLGGDSPPPFQRVSDTLQGSLPNLTVAVMPGQRHIAMDTDPDLFAREVLGFLSD